MSTLVFSISYVFSQDISIIKFKISNDQYNDEIAIRFFEDATDSLDAQWDAVKLFSPEEDVPGMSFSWNNIEYAVNSLPKIKKDITVPLKIKAGRTGKYQLEMEELYVLPKNVCLKIEDVENGNIISLNSGGIYEFDLVEGYNNVRLNLHFGHSMKSPNKELACETDQTNIVAEANGEGPWTFTWCSIDGDTLKSIQKNFKVDTLNNVASGIYIVETDDVKSVCKSRNDTVSISANSNISLPNYTITKACEGESNGSIELDLDENNTMSYDWSNGMITKNLDHITAGEYTLTIKNEDNCQLTQKFIVEELEKLSFEVEQNIIEITVDSKVTFYNTSDLMQDFTWDFGDGFISNEISPTHEFISTGIHNVTLSSSNGCNPASKTIYVNNTLEINDNYVQKNIDIYHNTEKIIVKSTLNLPSAIQISVLDLNGRLINNISDSGFKQSFEIDKPKNGIYLLSVYTEKGYFTKKISL